MPRKGPAVRRPIQPDPVYQNPLVTQLINRILLHGKKTTAEKIVYDALEQISQKTANDPVITLKKAVENVPPDARGPVAPRRRCDVPGADRGQAAARHHARAALVGNNSRARRENSMAERLTAEIMDAPTAPEPRSSDGRHAQDGGGEPGVRPLPVVDR